MSACGWNVVGTAKNVSMNMFIKLRPSLLSNDSSLLRAEFAQSCAEQEHSLSEIRSIYSGTSRHGVAGSDGDI